MSASMATDYPSKKFVLKYLTSREWPFKTLKTQLVGQHTYSR